MAFRTKLYSRKGDKAISISLRLCRILAAMVFCIFIFARCQKTTTSPATPSLSIQGFLALNAQGELSQVVVRLFAEPEDPLLYQVSASYPALGFAPLAPMLFDPAKQTPIATATPDAQGAFHFEDLNEGTYILDATLPGFACARPLIIDLPEDQDPDTLRLATLLPVSGNLNQATWHSGEAYLLTGNLYVLPEATLTIEQDVLILVEEDYTLTVAGGLEVQGAPTNPVRFRLTEDYSAGGGDWGGLKCDQPASLCELTGAVLQGASTALRVMGGVAQVSECLFDAPGAFGVYFSAEAAGWLRQSLVRDGDQGLVADNCAPHFEKNLILRMSGAGISVKTNSQATLHNNGLFDCLTGIWSDWETAPLIQYNIISGGSRALHAQDGFEALIQYNEFTGQTQDCIYLYFRNCYPIIENNNFFNAPDTILFINGFSGQQADTVFAPYNYWEGEEATGIPQRIVDGHDLSSPSNPVGPVIYEPFRMEPVPEAGP